MNSPNKDPNKDPNTDFDRPKLHELASSVMDGTADERQLRELTELLRESDAARDVYLRLVDLHAALSNEISLPPLTESNETRNVARPRRNWILVATAASLAASVLIAVAVTWYGSDDSVGRPDSFAIVAQSTEAVWDSEQIESGDRIGPTTISLRSGMVRLEFDSGVEVTLEGPAVFKLVDIAKAELASGLLTATVPAGAEGFTVDTPSAQVVDLGTSFGIDLSNDGFSKVSVFDGEVEVATGDVQQRDTAKRHLLSEGESIRIGANFEVEDIVFDPKPFGKIWPFASGIVGSTDTISFVPPWPKQIRFVQSDDQIFVRPEGPPMRLTTELKVNISEPSDCSTVDDLTPSTLKVDQSVRSYILHYAPETQLGRRRAKRMTGSITFARPVLGILVGHEELVASSRRFGRRGAGEANQRRELNFVDDPAGDRIVLSQDRKTVTLDLVAPGRSSDLVRVIVRDSRKTRRSKQRTGGFQPPR